MRCAAFILIGLLWSQSCFAVEVSNLYRAEAIVTGTEEPERTRGFKAALQDALVKLTGDIRLLDDERIAALVASPHSLVERFEYEDRMKDIPVHDEQGTRDRPHFLRVFFNSRLINRELERLQIRKWSSDRPLVAVWLTIETARGVYLLTEEGAEGYGQRWVLTETAERRGIPIQLPTAENAQRFPKGTAVEISQLQAASAAGYAILIGTLKLVEGGYWNIDWSLHSESGVQRWALVRVSFDRALKDGLEQSALVLSGNIGATADPK